MQTYQFHPLAEKYPLWSEAEQSRVVADMKEHGFDRRYPIFLYDGKIIMGRNRYLAAKAAGVEARFEELKLRKGETVEEAVERDNENRRHQTQQELAALRKGRVERVVAARQEGQSIRTIAEREGKHPSTIADDLQKAAVGGQTPEPPSGKVVGRDGKAQPAKKPLVEIDLRCEACKRKGAHIEGTCAGCKATKAEYIAKKGRKRGKRADKNGQVMIQWKDLEDAYGKLVRLGDDIMKQHGLFNSPVYHGLKRVLRETLTGIKAAEKEAKRIIKEKART